MYLNGNNIGDRGAAAIAKIIRTPCENTRRLQKVVISNCGITDDGLAILE